jgi:hypothetical protein
MKKKITALTRSAEFQPSSVNSEARTIELVWTTGARVLRSSWGDQFYEELEVSERAIDLKRLNSGAPFLNSHNQNSLSDVLGVVERAWVQGNEGRAIVRFSERAEVEGIWKDVSLGIIRNVSVGYRVNKFEKVGEADGVAVMRATNWSPFEISAVPVGADMQAQIRADEENTCEIEGTDMETTNEAVTEAVVETTPATEEAVEAPVAAAPAPEVAAPSLDADAVRAEAAATERARAAEIFETVAKAKLGVEVARKLIEGGASIENARKEIIEMISTKETIATAHIEAGAQDEVNTRKEAATAALLHRANPGMFKLNEMGRQYVGMSLVRIAEDFIGNVRGMTRSQVARRALMTSDFVELLGNVASKTLLQAYALQPKTFEPFVTRGSLPDYKPAKRISFGEMPNLLQMAEGAQYEQVEGIGEAAETIQLAKYGRMLEITDVLIANDDLNAFSRVGVMAGAAAARLESSLVYGVLTGNPVMADGKALFHADHGNLAAGSALDVAGIAAARKLMRVQKGLDGQDYLDIVPAFLVVGPDQEVAARQLLSAQVIPNSINEVNPFQASMQLIVDPRIEGNAFYMIASPTTMDTIEVASMEGMSGPELAQETEFSNDSVRYKVKHIIGVRPISHKSMVKNPGL